MCTSGVNGSMMKHMFNIAFIHIMFQISASRVALDLNTNNSSHPLISIFI